MSTLTNEATAVVDQALENATHIVHTGIPCWWGNAKNNEINVYIPHPDGGHTCLNAPGIAERFGGDANAIYSVLYERFPTRGRHTNKTPDVVG